MGEPERTREDISMLALGTILLRNRWRIVRWTAIGAVIAGAWVLTKPRMYVASTSFVSAGSDARRSGLSSLAGQFGLTVPAGDQSVSPEFYAALLQTRTLLLPIVRDTSLVVEVDGSRLLLLDALDIPPVGHVSSAREDEAIKRLRKMVGVTTAKATGIVGVTVTTKWRSVSLAVATSLIDRVNDYNQRTRQGQAAAERKFVEGRLRLASEELRAAENRLRRFLEANRAIGNAPELTIERDRIQRDVAARQDVFTSLTQSYEDARIREVRDMPAITIVEAPSVPAEPQPRGLFKYLLFGAVLGAVLSSVVSVASAMATRHADSRAEASEFAQVWGDTRRDLLRPFRSGRRRRERADATP